MENVIEPVHKPNWKKWVLIILAVALLSSLATLIAAMTTLQRPSEIQSTVTVTPTVTMPTDAGIPITEYTVSFARVGNKTYLRYKGKIYEEKEDKEFSDRTEISLADPNQYTWYGLVDSPIKTTSSTFFSDELFDFKVFPNTYNFIFTMRWDKPQDSQGRTFQDFKVYYYDAYKTSNKVSNPLSFESTENLSLEPFVPRIHKISSDGKYISFDMHSCWNCGGSKAQILVLNLETGASKRIGKTSYFAWKEAGNYEYKIYNVTVCPTLPPEEIEGMQRECFEDPKTLPLQTGSI